MKGWILLIVIVGLLWLMPFRTYETGRLLPVLCIQAQREPEGIRILTRWGEGFGADWNEAVADLKAEALGEIFFPTAEQAVFSDMELALEGARSGDLRPGAEVFIRYGMGDPEELYAYYSGQESEYKISDLMREGAHTHE